MQELAGIQTNEIFGTSLEKENVPKAPKAAKAPKAPKAPNAPKAAKEKIALREPIDWGPDDDDDDENDQLERAQQEREIEQEH